MKPYERRELGKATFYKLATWDPRSFTFRDGKQGFDTQALAIASAPGPGKYRVSVITDGKRQDLPAFEVGERVGGD